MNIAVIVFGGSGTRIHSNIPKQFIKIKGKELICYTIEKFETSEDIDEIALVTHTDYLEYVRKLVEQHEYYKVKHIVIGGSSRQTSVKNGLDSLDANDDDIILIHDGDRPLVSHKIIRDNIETIIEKKGIVSTVLEESESLSEISNSGRKVGSSLIQTPQTFRFKDISYAHKRKEGLEYPDDISLLEDELQVSYVKGDKYNFKVTTDIDLHFLETLL